MQVTSPKLASVMKDGGRGASSGGSRRRLRDLLVIAEVSLAFILLVGSGLMMRTFFGLMNAESGFDATNTVTVPVPIALKRFPDPRQLNAYLHEIRTAVEAVPGVVETALSCAPPMQGSCYGMPMQVVGRPVVDVSNRDGGFYKVVSPSYFTAMRLKLIKGRALSDRDVIGATPALVMNDRLAKLPFPPEVTQAAVQQETLRRRPELLQGDNPRAAAMRGVMLLCAVALSQAGEAGQAAVASVRDLLRRAYRASSLVECINSVLRMHQAQHRKLTQELINLKRLYWNCHNFRTGRRRGTSPYERLGVPWPEDLRWWDLLKMTPEQLQEKLSTAKKAA
jgi:hypothetical protein